MLNSNGCSPEEILAQYTPVLSMATPFGAAILSEGTDRNHPFITGIVCFCPAYGNLFGGSISGGE
jgi:hypothetical protein